MGGDQAFRKTELHGREHELTYAGALSYMRRVYSRDYAAADVAVYGMPWDLGTTYRPGARLGPQAIRAGSVQLAELYSDYYDMDPFKTLAVCDSGDVYFDGGQPYSFEKAVIEHVRPMLAAGCKPLGLGGDHFVTLPVIRALYEAFGPVALVHFDAHPDMWPDDGSRLDHGSMLTRAAAEGLLDVAHSIQIGVRTHCPNPCDIERLPAHEVHAMGPEAVIERIASRVGDAQVYMTFDVDCLDPAFAPGTGTPVVGGLSTAQVLAVLRGLCHLRWLGMDVVEVAPAYDHSEITAIAAATIGHEWLCIEAFQQRSR